MTDFDHQFQNGNITMRIRDTGGSVELWVLTNSQTYNHQQKYSYNVNGQDSPVLQFDMNNRGSWQRITTIYPNYRQNVRFTMYDDRLGFGSGDFWAWIERARVPDPPNPPYFPEEPHVDAIRVAFDFAYDGGMGIDQAEIWYSDDPNNAKWLMGNTRDTWIGNLQPRTWYYFWGKVHNGLGWSGLSGRSQALTDGVPDAPSMPDITAVTNNKVHTNYGFYGWDGGTPIREWQVGYGTDPNYPQFYQGGVSMDIGGLQPGQVYYFWARGRNDVGWGYWSARAAVRMQDAPAAPSTPDLSQPGQTSMFVAFTPNGDNGQPILGYQVGWSLTPDGPYTYFDLPGTNGLVTGLTPGATIYFRVRARNMYGWGPLSGWRAGKTTAGGWINVNGVWKAAVPYVNVNGVWKPALVWGKIAGVWKETG